MAGEGKVVPEGISGKDIVAIVAAEADFGVKHNDAHQRGQSHREHEKSPPMSIEKGVEPLGERGSVRGFHCLLIISLELQADGWRRGWVDGSNPFRMIKG